MFAKEGPHPQTPVDLEQAYNQLRSGIDISNRCKGRQVLCNVFIGSEAISWLTNRGQSATRSDAVAVLDQMMRIGLVKSVDGLPSIVDSYHFYRFTGDQDSTISVRLSPSSIDSTYPRWQFHPHTAHNSLVLDFALACEVQEAFVIASSPSLRSMVRLQTQQRDKTAAEIAAQIYVLLKLRERVRQVGKRNAPGWVEVSASHRGRQRIRRYRRSKPVGRFQTRKSTSLISASPLAFINSVLDMETRRQYEPHFVGGIVVQDMPLISQDNDNASALQSLMQKQSGSDACLKNKANVLQSMHTQTAPRQRQGPSALSDQSPPSSETWSSGPTYINLPVAHLNDPALQKVHISLTSRINELRGTAGCNICHQESRGLEDQLKFVLCACCSILACPSCCSQRVYDPAANAVRNVCTHCLKHSSRIQRISSPSRSKLAGRDTGLSHQVVSTRKAWGDTHLGSTFHPSSQEPVMRTLAVAHLQDPALQQTLERLSDRKAELVEAAVGCSVCGQGSKMQDTGLLDYMLCACCGILACPLCCSELVYEASTGEIRKVCAYCFDRSSRIAKNVVKQSSHHVGHPETSPTTSNGDTNMERGKKKMRGRALSGGKLPSDWGGVLSTEAGETQQSAAGKVATCTRCGLEVLREVQAIERHVDHCNGSDTSANDMRRASQAHKHQICSHSACLSPRIIYRTAESIFPPVLAPRECCVWQDHFMDTDGTAFVYEISVAHSSVDGAPCHQAAEILFLAYIARPVPWSERISSLTVISQIDAKAQLPRWLANIGADEGQYGLITNNFPEAPTHSVLACVPGSARDKRRSVDEDISLAQRSLWPLIPCLSQQPHASFETRSIDSSSRWTFEDRLASQDKEKTAVQLRDFELLRVVGRGGFGKVYQVRQRTSGQVYALKVLSKLDLVKRNQVERIRTERQVLREVRHPFIVHLLCAFHSTTNVYMVMSFCHGGDLFTLLRRHGRLSEEATRVYVAEIGLALQHLHDRDIIYRDLKPENLLIAEDGHIKLTDFGLARHFDIQPTLRTVKRVLEQERISKDSLEDTKVEARRQSSPPLYNTHSFCGTEEYLASEVLLNQGHGTAVDWWCLGLCMHEMLARKHPFRGISHLETLRNICAAEPVVAQHLSGSAKALVLWFLCKNPAERLSKLTLLKQHSFFAGTDWDGILLKRVAAPIIPYIQDAEDISAFSPHYTEERVGRYSEIEGLTPRRRPNGILAAKCLCAPFGPSRSDPTDGISVGSRPCWQAMNHKSGGCRGQENSVDIEDSEAAFAAFAYVDPTFWDSCCIENAQTKARGKAENEA